MPWATEDHVNMSARVIVREMRPGDNEEVGRVAGAAFSVDRQHSDPMFRDRADEFRAWEMRTATSTADGCRGKLVAEIGGRIVGIESYDVIEILPGLKIGNIAFFAVAPQWQNLGIGRQLTAAVKRKLNEHGLLFGMVHTDASAFSAIKLYESMGLKIYELEMVCTHRCERQGNEGGAGALTIEKAGSNQTGVVQDIDVRCFRPHEFFIHREFPLHDYNRHLQTYVASRERLAEIEQDIGAFLLGRNGHETIGYCRVRPKTNFSEFFYKKIADLEIKAIRTGDVKRLLASAVRALGNAGIDIVDILIRYLDRPLFDAVQDLGFRLVHCPVRLGGKLNGEESLSENVQR